MTTPQEIIEQLAQLDIQLWVEDEKLKYRAPQGKLTAELKEAITLNKSTIMDLIQCESKIVLSSDDPYAPFPLNQVQASYLMGRTQVFNYGDTGCHGYAEFNIKKRDFTDKDYVTAWAKVCQVHDALSLVIRTDGTQRIDPTITPTLQYFSTSNSEKYLQLCEHFRTKLKNKNYRITDADAPTPLVDIVIVSGSHTERCILSIDLMITDFRGISQILFDFENALLYPDKNLKKPSLNWKDYNLYEQSRKQSKTYAQEYRKAQKYWDSQINNLPEPLYFPLAQENVQKPLYKRLVHIIEERDWEILQERSQQFSLTPSGVFMAVFSRVARRYRDMGSGSDDSGLIAVTVSDRHPYTDDIDRIVGDFTNTVLAEIPLEHDPTFTCIADITQKNLFASLAFSHVNGIELSRKLCLHHKGKYDDFICPIVFTSTINSDLSKGIYELLELDLQQSQSRTPQTLLDIQIADYHQGCSLIWDYREDGFNPHVLNAAFIDFCTTIHNLIKDENAWKGDPLPLRTLSPIAELPLDKDFLHEDILLQLNMSNDIAIIDGDKEYSYPELRYKVSAIMHYYQKRHIKSHSGIIIDLQIGIDQIAAEIASLLIDCFFIPVDPQWPQERKESIVDSLCEAGHNIIICTQKDIDQAHDIFLGDKHVTLEYQHAESINTHSLAYVIFTSGTTGTPKGVSISHKQVLTTLQSINELIELRSSDSILAITRHSFDLSIFNYFALLSVGGKIIIPSSKEAFIPSAWVEKIPYITIWNSVPAQLEGFLDYIETENIGKDAIPHLRVVLISGDKIDNNLPQRVYKIKSQCRFIALGGATEASIWSNYYEPSPENKPNTISVPYGKALARQSICILNDDLEPTEIGQIGEIHIGGPAVSSGYIRKNNTCTPDPFYIHPISSDRYYRTGDMGRLLNSGDIEILGRNDNQIKLHGYRIELSEIDFIICQYEHIQKSISQLIPINDVDTICTTIIPASINTDIAIDNSHILCALDDSHKYFIDNHNIEKFVKLLNLLEKTCATAMLNTLKNYTQENPNSHIFFNKIPYNHRALLHRWVNYLCNKNLITFEMDRIEFSSTADNWKYSWPEIQLLGHEIKYSNKQLEYIYSCLDQLHELINNTVDPLYLLFPEGKSSTAFASYGDNLNAHYLNGLVASGITAQSKKIHSINKKIHILEIGAGVGGTTNTVIDNLQENNFILEKDYSYLFTDISSYFLDTAQEKWPDIETAILDINNCNTFLDSFENYFDIIICANVLHNAKNIPISLDILAKLLNPHGQLIIIDSTEKNAPLLSTMEFKEGLNDFTDERENTDEVFYSYQQWLTAIEKSCFSNIISYPPVGHCLEKISQTVFWLHKQKTFAPIDTSEIKKELEKNLPYYMVPAQIAIETHLPLTSNSKIDYQKLASHFISLNKIKNTIDIHTSEEISRTPLNQYENRIANIWRKIFKKENTFPLYPHSHFFELGGDSLLLARAIGLMRKELPEAGLCSWDILLRSIIANPTISGCSSAIYSTVDHNMSIPTVASPEYNPVILITEAKGKKYTNQAIVIIHDGSGNLSPYTDLIERLSHRSEHPAIIGITRTPDDNYTEQSPKELFLNLVEKYIYYLPNYEYYHFLGYCMGGLLAALMAESLATNKNISSLIVISSYKIPFLFHDDLLLDYSFTKLMLCEANDIGFDISDELMGQAIERCRNIYGTDLPERCLHTLIPEMPELALSLQNTPNSVAQRLEILAQRLSKNNPNVDWTVESLMNLRKNYVSSLHAVHYFHNPGYIGNITFLKQKGDLYFLPKLKDDMTAFWENYCLGELTIHEIEGTHFDCLKKPYVDNVASLLAHHWED